MSYFDGPYKKRLNRYGLDYQSRIQGQREREFEDYLLKSIYRVDFCYHGRVQPATLEKYKQDYAETQAYLLTRTNLKLPAGTILEIFSQDGERRHWMVWWLEQIEASGYNRYVILRMTNKITWEFNGAIHSQWFHFRGPGSSRIDDTKKSGTNQAVYEQNDNLYMIISKVDPSLRPGVYFEITEKGITKAYKVVEEDVNSTPGVGYYSLDPRRIEGDKSNTQTAADPSAENFWLNGGK